MAGTCRQHLATRGGDIQQSWTGCSARGGGQVPTSCRLGRVRGGAAAAAALHFRQSVCVRHVIGPAADAAGQGWGWGRRNADGRQGRAARAGPPGQGQARAGPGQGRARPGQGHAAAGRWVAGKGMGCQGLAAGAQPGQLSAPSPVRHGDAGAPAVQVLHARVRNLQGGHRAHARVAPCCARTRAPPPRPTLAAGCCCKASGHCRRWRTKACAQRPA